MAATVRITENLSYRGGVRRIRFEWTSDADGDAGGSYTVNGVIVRVVFNPGTPSPTEGYNVTLTDANGFDILSGRGEALSATNASHVCPAMPITDGVTENIVPIAVNEEVTLAVEGAGDSKQGTVDIYAA